MGHRLMLALTQSTEVDPFASVDEALSPLLELAESAAANHSRLPVLSLWRQLPFVSLFAAHLHLRWPGEVKSLPLSPRIGIFPFFASDLDLLSRPLYQVQKARFMRQAARAKRFLSSPKSRGELYPDWEQAVDRWRQRLEHLVLPASCFISIDRVDDSGDVKQGNRKIIGRLAPRGEPRPQLLVPARAEVTRRMVQTFNNLDLVIVNVQNIRGKHLAASIEYFLTEIDATVPMLIVASSPADLTFVRAIEPPSKKPIILTNLKVVPSTKVKEVNRDRAMAERRFCFAIEGLAEKSDTISRMVSQAKHTWWATRQSMSLDTPREALAFEKSYSDTLARSPNCELELLEEAKRLILDEAQNISMREDRRNSVIRAALHEAKHDGLLILTRSARTAEDLKTVLAQYLGISVCDLTSLGVDVISVFSPWPTGRYGTGVACGYFGPSTVDMLFAGGAREAVLVVDPIEARVAVWDIEKRFCGVPDLPETIRCYFGSISTMLEAVASPSSEPISLPTLSENGMRPMGSGTTASTYGSKTAYVCLCFADGSTQETASNARFEVVGRKRLQLQSVPAKELEMGDQVVLLNDDERAGFSERLLRVMDEGRFRADREARSTWVTTLRAVRATYKVALPDIKQRIEKSGIDVDPSTIRTWLPTDSSEECGVPEGESAFLAFAHALEIAASADELRKWFAAINRLRINHRRIGRALVRAIRGAYLGRLDPVTVARMEKEWGVEAKALLEAARIGIVDDVIPLGSEVA
jgi:hypothetical protein